MKGGCKEKRKQADPSDSGNASTYIAPPWGKDRLRCEQSYKAEQSSLQNNQYKINKHIHIVREGINYQMNVYQGKRNSAKNFNA